MSTKSITIYCCDRCFKEEPADKSTGFGGGESAPASWGTMTPPSTMLEGKRRDLCGGCMVSLRAWLVEGMKAATE